MASKKGEARHYIKLQQRATIHSVFRAEEKL